MVSSPQGIWSNEVATVLSGGTPPSSVGGGQCSDVCGCFDRTAESSVENVRPGRKGRSDSAGLGAPGSGSSPRCFFTLTSKCTYEAEPLVLPKETPDSQQPPAGFPSRELGELGGKDANSILQTLKSHTPAPKRSWSISLKSEPNKHSRALGIDPVYFCTKPVRGFSIHRAGACHVISLGHCLRLSRAVNSHWPVQLQVRRPFPLSCLVLVFCTAADA